MNYKTLNSQTPDSINSNSNLDNTSNIGNTYTSNTIETKYRVYKTDANNETIFEKNFDSINEAVAECCECEYTTKYVSAPQFENTAEGTRQAAQWLSANNSKYNYSIVEKHENNSSMTDKISNKTKEVIEDTKDAFSNTAHRVKETIKEMG